MEWTDYLEKPLSELYAELESNTNKGKALKIERMFLKTLIDKKEQELFVDITIQSTIPLDLSDLNDEETKVVIHFCSNPNLTMIELGEYFGLSSVQAAYVIKKVLKGEKYK